MGSIQGRVTILAPRLNCYNFTGKERDTESSLDYFGERHYASSMGRFMTVDQVADETIPVPLPFADFRNPTNSRFFTENTEI